jgi:hypothetical protein
MCICTYKGMPYGTAWGREFLQRDNKFYGRRQLIRIGYKENILMGNVRSNKKHWHVLSIIKINITIDNTDWLTESITN